MPTSVEFQAVPRPTRFIAGWIGLALVSALAAGAPCAAGTAGGSVVRKNRVGFAVLASSVGTDYSVDALVELVRAGDFRPVVLDWAWITAHWKRTDFAAVERFAARLKKARVPVHAMYRPRWWTRERDHARLRHQVTADGATTQKKGRREICYGNAAARDWGIEWGRQILTRCPSVSAVIIYNPTMRCRCPECVAALERDSDHHQSALVTFFREAKAAFRKVNRKARVGMAGIASKGAYRRIDEVIDFAFPFLPITEKKDWERMLADHARLKAALKCECPGGLAKVEWGPKTKMPTAGLVEFIRTANREGASYFFWTLHATFLDKRFDVSQVAAALGLKPERLRAALDALPGSEAKPAGSLEESLARARATKDWNDKAWAELRGLGDRAVPGLTAIMKDRALVAPRYMAVHCLGAIGTEKAIHTLIAGLESDSFNVRRTAAGALGRLGVEKARSRILRLARSDPYQWRDPKTGERRYLVRISAEKALKQLDTARQAGAAAPKAPALGDTLAKLGSEVRWERDIAAALERARRERKLILAAVNLEKYGGEKGETPKAQGMVFNFMLASLFTGTDIVPLVNRRFVPVRVSYHLMHRTMAIHKTRGGRPLTGDPLEKLGTNTLEVKPQALLVVSPEGKLLTLLNGMAAYDPGMVHRFLRDRLAEHSPSKPRGQTFSEHLHDGDLEQAEGALAAIKGRDEAVYRRAQLHAVRGEHAKAVETLKSMPRNSRWFGPGAALKGVSLMRTGDFEASLRALRSSMARGGHTRAAEARYWLGCVCERLDRKEEAAAVWRTLIADHGETPFAWKARLRLRNEPPYFDEYESLLSFAVPGTMTGTEYAVDRDQLAAFIGYPIDFLLRQQQPSGFWRGTDEHADKFGGFGYKTAVSSLALMALMQWEDRVDGRRKRAVKEALERGTAAILKSMDKIRETSITFDFTYLLWFLLRRSEATGDRKLRPHVQAAVDGLSGAQYPDGGWGYCGRTTSFNTGPALYLLARSKQAGFKVDPKVVQRGIAVLRALRLRNRVYHYTQKKGFHWMSKPSMSTGRSPICEAALLLHGLSGQEDVARTIDEFFKHEHLLRRPVKVYYNACNPEGHAGYHYLFAYHGALTAIAALGEAGARYRDRLHGGILSYVELDNTWVDNHRYGKVYGTSMAVLILGELERKR